MRGLFMLGLMAASAVLASTGSAQEDTARSSPRDRTFYTRPAIPDDIVRDEPPTDGNVAPAAIAPAPWAVPVMNRRRVTVSPSKPPGIFRSSVYFVCS